MPSAAILRLSHTALAAAAAALVLFLTVLAASPETHEHLHADCHHDESHACGVTLFAQGLWTSLEAFSVPQPQPAWTEFIPLRPAELRLTAPRYLRHPERGPPVG